MQISSGTKGLVVYQGKIILVLRDNKPSIPYPNTWEYIGGGKDENESFEDAGKREIQEELGISPQNYVFLGYDIYPNRQAGRFIARLSESEFNNLHLGNEGVELKLFTLDEAIMLNMAPGLKAFLINNLQELKNIIENGQPIFPDRFVFSHQATD